MKNVSLPRCLSPFAPYILLIAVLLVEGGFLIARNRPIWVPKGDNVVLLTDLPWKKSEQSYGRPKVNESVEGHVLTLGNRVYLYGIGSHAPSNLAFGIPENADTLFVGAGIDDECNGEGSVIFIVKVDGKEAWRSNLLRGRDGTEFTSVPLQGANLLELETDPNGSNNCDHADWLNAYIKLR